jgi:integrase
MRGLGRIFKRGAVFWIAYYYNGVEKRESSHSQNERQAQRLLKKRLGEIGAGKLVGPSEEKLTFDQLAEDLITDYEVNGKRSLKSVKLSIRHLHGFFGFDKALSITTDRVRTYIAKRQQEIAENHRKRVAEKLQAAQQLKERAKALPHSARVQRLLAEANWLEEEAEGLETVSNASINRELSALKRMFALAVQAGKLSSKPHIPTLEENNARQGFLDHASFIKISSHLPNHLKDPVWFLYLSGWRVSEMRALEWRDVDLPGKVLRLRPEISKNKKGRVLPLNGELLGIIENAQASRRLDCNAVFHNDGARIGDFRKAWKSALITAGLGKKFVHDFRRTAVRNLTRAGNPEKISMELTGHKTRAVFDRYNIVSEADLTQATEKLYSHLNGQPKTSTVTPLRQTA